MISTIFISNRFNRQYIPQQFPVLHEKHDTSDAAFSSTQLRGSTLYFTIATVNFDTKTWESERCRMLFESGIIIHITDLE